jgi:peptidoglycan/xylan/chitin deacetylase (PgdA/CDA1 family)
MIGDGWAGVRTPHWAVLCLGLLTCITAQAASASDCPGHPDALGTSRTLVVDPREHTKIGTMQYAETLPLEDHEVVLTFDDGPLPRNSNQILEILASQCIKATFFEIGQMARAYPEGVRKLRDAGHSIGTHTQNHPLTMNRMPIERARQEIDDGIASVKAALGDDTSLAPFLRIPGLMRAEAVEDYLASQGIQTWSADFPADDWRHISSARVYDLAVKRIEAKGKGILLLHDIHPRTVAALPRILQELKAQGFRIVHVVPATPDRPATPTDPQQWLLHPPLEAVAISHWPKIPNFTFADAGALPAPLLTDSDWFEGQFPSPFDRSLRHGPASWPQTSQLALNSTTIALSVPAQSIFEIQENPRATMQSLSPSGGRAVQTVSTEANSDRLAKLTSAEADEPRSSRRAGRGKLRAGRGAGRGAQRTAASHAGRHGTRIATPARRGGLKHLVQVKKRNV